MLEYSLKLANDIGRGRVWKFIYDVDREAIVKGDLVGLWESGLEVVVVKLCPFV